MDSTQAKIEIAKAIDWLVDVLNMPREDLEEFVADRIAEAYRRNG